MKKFIIIALAFVVACVPFIATTNTTAYADEQPQIKFSDWLTANGVNDYSTNVLSFNGAAIQCVINLDGGEDVLFMPRDIQFYYNWNVDTLRYDFYFDYIYSYDTEDMTSLITSNGFEFDDLVCFICNNCNWNSFTDSYQFVPDSAYYVALMANMYCDFTPFSNYALNSFNELYFVGYSREYELVDDGMNDSVLRYIFNLRFLYVSKDLNNFSYTYIDVPYTIVIEGYGDPCVMFLADGSGEYSQFAFEEITAFYPNFFNYDDEFTEYRDCNSINKLFQVYLNTQTDTYTWYDRGYFDGFDVGYNNGLTQGYNNGYNAGISYERTQVTETSASYIKGYQKGVDNASEYSFNSLFSAIFDVPLNSIMSMFNLEIFGVNLQPLMTALFSIALIVTIISLVL